MGDANKLVPDVDGGSESRMDAGILARVAGKWTVLVVAALSNGPMRYGGIRRRVAGISQRMLTLTLKGLEEDGLLKRTMFPTIPPRVDYELTELGQKLLVALQSLCAFAKAHRPEILTARQKFAAQRTEGTSG